MKKGVKVVAMVMMGGVFMLLKGVPLPPGPFELKQPNGYTFMAVGYGDEFYGRIETEDGWTIVQGRDFYWY
jgi:hypothetical protein